ncbi:MAG TPA: dihydrolipoamide acetyltransferase family protein [Myxococcales bacterium]|nr:dihydrolipoamide acetyltransferase family protein [Myxococcales bacterium]
MAQFEFKLPDIGEGVVEGEIVKWLVKAGDQIVEDQPIVEVMTDKATVTIPSPRRGKVVRTVGDEGSIAKVHGTLLVLEVAGEAAEPAPLQTAHLPAAAGAAANGNRRGIGKAAAGNGEPGGKVLATPVTRRMAREMGIDLSAVGASGPQGRVMKADLLDWVENAQKSAPPQRTPPAPTGFPADQKAPAPPPPLPAPLAEDEVRPLRGLRKSIARSMVQSHAHVVPFTFVEECDTTALTALRTRLNASLEKRGEAKLSYLPFIAKALLAGFRRFPELNALMDEEKQALVVKKDVNLGFGAATDQGLTVFVVKDVAHKSLRQISAEIDRLARSAREGKLQLADLGGSTFTVTSLGKDGGLFATPVVKHPEVGILGVHKIKEYAKPVRAAGGKVEVEIVERMNLSTSFDHRVIDGHIGAAFLYEVIGALESPEALLID